VVNCLAPSILAIPSRACKANSLQAISDEGSELA
jgi:hypothetical protein